MPAPASSPLGLEYKPLEQPLLDNPHPFYARLRREPPVTFAPAFHLWVVSRYQDVATVLKDPRPLQLPRHPAPTSGPAHTPERVGLLPRVPIAGR
ncbi:MAG TPA: hypothetical protein VF815_05235 [Myxococcaceae bacterium]